MIEKKCQSFSLAISNKNGRKFRAFSKQIHEKIGNESLNLLFFRQRRINVFFAWTKIGNNFPCFFSGVLEKYNFRCVTLGYENPS